MSLRPIARTRRAALAVLVSAGSIVLASGCDPRSLVYFLQPFEPTIAAACPTLKGKKVVVLAHAAAGQGEYQSLDHELAESISRIIKEKIKKVDVVPAEKVALWVDAHPGYTDPSEAARAFDADVAIFLEIEKFQIESPNSPDLFQGVAKVHVKVYELAEPTDDKGKPIEGKPREVIVIHDEYVDSLFPRVQESIPVSASVNRNAFRKKFFDVIVSEVSWHFVEHANGDDIQRTTF
jgi:hypothetical protein